MMSTCTFFGHRDCPDTIRDRLWDVLTELIEDQGVDMFYVGREGRFDAIVHSLLRGLKQKYPLIDYAVVLARMPGKKTGCDDETETMLPEGIEFVHPRYAICWRNDWMLARSDYVVTCIARPWGGAYRYAQKAIRQS